MLVGRRRVPQVAPHRLRHVPLFPAIFNPGPGVRIEGYLHDCWWPGEVVEQHHRKGFRICFDDGDNAWLVRRNVRPMLKRAPEPGSWAPGASSLPDLGLGVAGTPPMPSLPLRFPHELNPHAVVRGPRLAHRARPSAAEAAKAVATTSAAAAAARATTAAAAARMVACRRPLSACTHALS